MRILELHIERYGGLIAQHADFSDGFNLVYGGNEAGKSTILSFIRAMFYGLTGGAHRISENERKLRLPWGQERMGGWLTFNHDGRTYRIERTFGTVRRQDQRILRDETTGELIALPGAREIGDWLFGVREAEFGNTVCIRQLATAEVGAEDDTLAKLANLAATGDERISSSEIDGRLRKAMVFYRAEKGSGGRINALGDRRLELASERQNVLSLEEARSADIQQYQKVVLARDAASHFLDEGKRLLRACRDREAIGQADQTAGRLADLGKLEQAADSLRIRLRLDGRDLEWTDLASLRARRDQLNADHIRLNEHIRQFDQQQAERAKLQDRQARFDVLRQLEAGGALQVLDQADKLDQELLDLRRRLVAVGELQNSQAPVMAQSMEARRHCEAAQLMLDEFQDEATAELQAASADTERRQLAWTTFIARQEVAAEAMAAAATAATAGAGVTATRKPDALESDWHGLRRPSRIALVAGLFFLVAGIAGGLSGFPAAFVLVPVGFLAVGLYLGSILHHPTTSGNVQPAARIANAADGSQTNAEAQALQDAWTDSQTRLDTLRTRRDLREQQLVQQLADSHKAWEFAVASERQAIAVWRDALLTLQPSPDLPMDAARLLAQTQVTASSLLSSQTFLKEQQAQVRQQADALLNEAGCPTASLFRQTLEQMHDLDRESVRLNDDISQRADAVAAAVARQEQMEGELRQDLLRLAMPLHATETTPENTRKAAPEDAPAITLAAASETAPKAAPDEVTLDDLLETVRQKLSELEQLQAAIREKRLALGDADGGRTAADLTAAAQDTRARLLLAFPDGDSGLATALEQFYSKVNPSSDLETANVAGLSDLESANVAGLTDASAVARLANPAAEQRFAAPADSIMACARQLPAALDQLQTRQQEAAGEAIRLESDLRHRFSQLRGLEEIDQELNAIEQQLLHAENEYAALALARDTVDGAFRELQQSFGPQLNRRGGEILARLTAGRHSDMRVDRSLQIAVPDPRTGQLHEFDYLSGGTIDQAYLALRLAVAELIGSPRNRLPLLLDDVLMQYDDLRAEAGMTFLDQYAKEQDLQILLFTCHGRLLAGTGARVIQLAGAELP